MRIKKLLDNLHFWVGGQSGEIYVGVRDKYGGIGERVIVTEKVINVSQEHKDFKGIETTELPSEAAAVDDI